MHIGIVGPEARISASTKIAFGQCNSLARRGHDVSIILHSRGLGPVKALYTGMFDRLNLIELEPVRFVSSVFDRFTSRYRRMVAGTHLPVMQDVWYQDPKRFLNFDSESHSVLTAGHVNIDIAAMVLRSAQVSRLLAKRGCRAVICNATVMALPVMPLYLVPNITRMFYFFDMPISKTLVTEGRKPNSPVVRSIAEFEKWVVGQADVLACCDRLVAKDWLDWYGVKLEFLPPGCTPSSHYPRNRSNYVLTVTYWNPDKRPFYFLDIAEGLRHSQLSLVMAGHWPNPNDLSEMRRRVRERHLEEKLILVPDPTEDVLREIYPRARCFIAPPKSGGYHMGALEAAAFGTPILYPKVAGAWDMFSPGIHGFVENVENVADVVDCVRKFENDKLVFEMGQEIWTRAKQLSWEVHSERVEQLLSQ